MQRLARRGGGWYARPPVEDEPTPARILRASLAWLRWERDLFGDFGLLPPSGRADETPRGESVVEQAAPAAPDAPMESVPVEAARSRAPARGTASDRSGGDASGASLPEMPEPLQRALFGGAAPSPAAPPRPLVASEESSVEQRPTGLPPEARARRLAELRERVEGCTACRLHEGRTRTVFARGAEGAEVVFVGEGPGFHEDQQGLPFVGPAGQLLDRMVAAMGLGEGDYYICNVVKCRPPGNRTPLPEEVAACEPYLQGQLEAIAPRVIVALGRPATEALGCMPPGGRGWRGRWGTWRGIPVMPTYHPAFLLRTPARKRDVWEDLKAVLRRLGREPPSRGRGR